MQVPRLTARYTKARVTAALLTRYRGNHHANQDHPGCHPTNYQVDRGDKERRRSNNVLAKHTWDIRTSCVTRSLCCSRHHALPVDF